MGLQKVTLVGGVNLLEDPKAIDDSECVGAKNLWPTNAGLLKTRPAVGLVAGLNTGSFEVPIALYIPPFDSVIDGIVITRQVVANPPSNTRVDVANIAGGVVSFAIDLGVVTGIRPAIFSNNRAIYVFGGPGATNTGAIVSIDPATGNPAAGVFTFLGLNNGPLRPKVAVPYRSRFFYANFGPGHESDGGFSDDYLPNLIGDDLLAANGRFFTIGGRDGDRIVGAVEVMLTAVGSPAQSALLVLREFSAYLITGEPSLTTDAGSKFGTMQVNKVAFNCGCSSADSIVTTPYGTIWAGHDDVWLFDHQQVPRRIGTKIRAALERTPPTMRYLWHAAYFNGAYRLAIAGDGQGPTDDSPMQDQWWLDLRGGAPQGHTDAKWWGPQQFLTDDPTFIAPVEQGSRFMSVDTRPGRDHALYGISVNNFGLWLQTYDVSGTRDCDNAPGSTEDLRDTDIVPELLTKDYCYGDPEIDKIYLGAEVSVWASQQTRLIIEAQLDGSRQVDIQAIPVPQIGFILGANSQLVGAAQVGPVLNIPAGGLAYVIDPSGNQRMQHQFQALAAYSSPTLRAVGKFQQFKMYNNAGYFVDEARSFFSFTVGSNSYTATIPPGMYDNIITFCDALVLAMNVVTSNAYTFTHNQAGRVTLQLVAITATATWRPRWLTGGQAAATLLVGSMLGFDVTAEPAAALTQTAVEVAPYRQAADLEIAGLTLRYDVINRRPI